MDLVELTASFLLMARSPKRRFIDELEDFMSEESAEQTLSAVVSFGRYAEVFAYDDDRAMFSLENPA